MTIRQFGSTVDPARAEWVLRYLAVLDEVESLRHASEDALGLDDANEVSEALEGVEATLKHNLPRLRKH